MVTMIALLYPKKERPWSINCASMECQGCVKDVYSYTFGNQRAALSSPSKVNVFVGRIANKASNILIASLYNERQRSVNDF